MGVVAVSSFVAVGLVSAFSIILGTDGGGLRGGGAAAPAVDCLGLLSSEMSDCLNYISSGSGAGAGPVKSCCAGLKKVVATDAKCLCQGFSMAGQLGITINMKKAQLLPSACHLSSISSLTSCAMSPTGAVTPALSPSSGAEAPTVTGGVSSSGSSNLHVPAQAPGPGSTFSGVRSSSSTITTTTTASLLLPLLLLGLVGLMQQL